MRSKSIVLLSCAVASILASANFTSAAVPAPEDVQFTKPVVRVVTPSSTGFLMSAGSETRLMVAVEVRDGTGHGIDTDDAGIPRFIDPDANVEAFARYIVAHETYADKGGDTVMQLIAEIPADKLTPVPDLRMPPPVGSRRVPPRLVKDGFVVPRKEMVEVVRFKFQVKDRSGAVSDPNYERAMINVGLASSVWVPTVEEQKRIKEGRP